MNTMLDKMQEKLSPIAMKVGNQKFLVALRDSFVGTMPVIMTGFIALLLNAFLVDLPQQFHLESITKTFQWLVDINNLVFKGSIPIVSLLFIYCLGVNIAKIYKVDTVSTGLVSLASFVISIGSTVTKSFPLANVGDVKLDQILQGIDNLAFDGKNLMVTIGNVIPGNHINARGRKGGISSSCWGSVVVTSSERLLETSLR